MSQPPPKRRNPLNVAGCRRSVGYHRPPDGPYVLTRAECEQVKAACRLSARNHGASMRVRGCGRNRAAKELAAKQDLTPPTEQA